jgi:hypothetical protein
MTFEEVLEQVLELLRQERRVSYHGIQAKCHV